MLRLWGILQGYYIGFNKLSWCKIGHRKAGVPNADISSVVPSSERIYLFYREKHCE